jgi:hypothetical protein
MVFSNADGDLELVDMLLNSHTEVDMAISLGDMAIFSESSPLKSFLRKRYRVQADQAIAWNKQGRSFCKPVHWLYGTSEDILIPNEEMNIGLLSHMPNGIQKFNGYSEDVTDTNRVNIGFLNGYYNNQAFHAQNINRDKRIRKRQALALCQSDFTTLIGKQVDYLFSFESPYDKPLPRRGCPQIGTLINELRPKLAFFGHHRISYKGDGLIGLPSLELGYAILDINSGECTVYFKPTGMDKYITMNELESL